MIQFEPQTKDKLQTLWDKYTDIFLRHVVVIGLPSRLQMTLELRWMLAPQSKVIHFTILIGCLIKTRTDRHRKSHHNTTTHFQFCGSRHHYTQNERPLHQIIDKMVVNLKRINELLDYWSYPLMGIERIFQKYMGQSYFQHYTQDSATITSW